METPRKNHTAVKYYAVLKALYEKFGLNEFHHTELRNICATNKVSGVFQTVCQNYGIINSSRHGYYKMRQNPIEGDAMNIYRMSVAYYKQKADERKVKIQQANSLIVKETTIPPSVSIEDCIEILKREGYKIMKQTVTFKEI